MFTLLPWYSEYDSEYHYFTNFIQQNESSGSVQVQILLPVCLKFVTVGSWLATLL